jgi:hypothetical protein
MFTISQVQSKSKRIMNEKGHGQEENGGMDMVVASTAGNYSIPNRQVFDLKDFLEVIEVVGIGKREKEEVYKLISRRLQVFQEK